MNLTRCLRLAALVLLAWTLALNPSRVAQAAGQEPPAAAQAASPAAKTPPDLEDGKRQFEQNCSTCHGVDAGGQEGPDLHGVPDSLGDAAVQGIIRRGIPGTAMPAFYTVTDKQAADIVAYLRTLSGTGKPEKAIGDPQKGEALYNSSGCSACHMIDGHGGSIGPELSRIGAMRGPSNLKARLLDPGANLPQVGGGLFGNSLTQYLMFRAVEKDGHEVEGTRMGEDSFTIVLKDASGKFHGFRKPDLRSLEKEPGKSFMPSFKGTLSDAQLDDVVAYLMSLKSAQ
ncbi:MAG TPA: c-type cytochrome [Candidatus Acidoferrales bacterium]|nr:c-type cytochrome [Candidatus Acidoferrales bacterium]